MNLAHSCLLEYSGTFVHRGAGCKYIVDKQDRFAGHLFRTDQPKGTGHILFPFVAGKLNLRPCGPKPDQVIVTEWQDKMFCQGGGKQNRLIKTPLAQAGTMKRYRNNKVNGSYWKQMGSHPVCDWLSQRPAGTVLELMDGFPEWAFKGPYRKRLVKTR
jgi:hypothetical protein